MAQPKKELTKEEIITMIYNLPHNTIIKTKKRALPATSGEGGNGSTKQSSEEVKISKLPFAGLAAPNQKRRYSLLEDQMAYDFYSKLKVG